MKILNGQVHIAEALLVLLLSLMSYTFGYNLPLFALMLMVFWPFLLIQLVFEGTFWGLIALIGWVFRRKDISTPVSDPTEKRTGIARFIWLLPLLCVTGGYGRHVWENGTWLW